MPAFEATERLFVALIDAETGADQYAQQLDRLHELLEVYDDWQRMPYIAPPRGEESLARRAHREEIRSKVVDHHRHLPAHFDTYHRMERFAREAIEKAKRCAAEASPELDLPTTAPLDWHTSQIRLDLVGLGASIPPPMLIGDRPPADAAISTQVRQRIVAIAEWINRLRAFTRPVPPTRPGELGPIAARSDPLAPIVLAGEGAQGTTVDDSAVSPPLAGRARLERDAKHPGELGLMSSDQLAALYGFDPEALRKALNRWKSKNDKGWVEASGDRRMNTPKYLYEVSAVLNYLIELHRKGTCQPREAASDETSDETSDEASDDRES